MASVNDIIGNYRLLEEIDCGTFGCVYRSEHAYLPNRPFYALKLLIGTHLNSQKEKDNFMQEARLLAMLEHPHILPIIDAGFHGRFPYMVTEYAPNSSLRKRLQKQPEQPLPEKEALTILSQIGMALQHAHEQNVIHRDLKPENILFNTKGDALLADFGIATILDSSSVRQGTIIGTPAYMAPEQFRGTASKEGDQYALGCIAYELFTGQKPFKAPDYISMACKHLEEIPIPPRKLNPNLPEHIEQAILKAMAKDRKERFASVEEFVTALHKTKEQWFDEGDALYEAECYKEALLAYDHAIRLGLNYPKLHCRKGTSLRKLARYNEALLAYDCPVPDIINTATRRGIGSHGQQREELYGRAQTQGGAGKHAA
ncbi:MAG: serine/threonine protein kinase [Chloroflexota bacterium]|nr:serine/threonine protein kinase [Chloroflexota bacterium]